MTDSGKNNFKRLSSASKNMSILIDDMVKKSLRSFKESGNINIDTKALKESVAALRELYALLEDYSDSSQGDEGIIVRLEKQIEEWSK